MVELLATGREREREVISVWVKVWTVCWVIAHSIITDTDTVD